MSEPIVTKRCSKCNQVKPLSDFYKHPTGKDGYASTCKDCKLSYAKKYSQTERGKEVWRKSAKRYEKTQNGKATHRRYRQSEKGKAAYARYAQTENGRVTIKARQIANSAVKTGRLPSPKDLLCYYCSQPAEEYHHPSYTFKHWLDVIPVCIKCHRFHNHSNSVIKHVSNLANPIFS